MYQAIIILHVLFGLAIIGLVLMQHGKGADAGAAFGSGASGTVFGARGAASFLSRTTAIFAALFFVTSLTLAVLAGHRESAQDIMDQLPAAPTVTPDLPEIPQAQPAAPSAPSAADVPAVESAPAASEPQTNAAPAVVSEPPSAPPQQNATHAEQPADTPVVEPQ